jgi:hypothetical protein
VPRTHDPSCAVGPSVPHHGIPVFEKEEDPCRRTIAMGGASPRSIDGSTALGYGTARAKNHPATMKFHNQKFHQQNLLLLGPTGSGVFSLGHVTTPAFLSEHTEHPQFAQGWVRKPQFHFPLKPMALDHRCLIWRHSSGCSRSSPPHVAESALGHWLARSRHDPRVS